jgi:hypothetical protein
MAMLEQVGLGGYNALKLRQKAVQWLKTNGSRAMDDGKVIAARCLGLLPRARMTLMT